MSNSGDEQVDGGTASRRTFLTGGIVGAAAGVIGAAATGALRGTAAPGSGPGLALGRPRVETRLASSFPQARYTIFSAAKALA